MPAFELTPVDMSVSLKGASPQVGEKAHALYGAPTKALNPLGSGALAPEKCKVSGRRRAKDNERGAKSCLKPHITSIPAASVNHLRTIFEEPLRPSLPIRWPARPEMS